MEVHGAGGVHEQWSVFSGDTKIEGARIPGKVALNSEQENLRVFILEEHLRSSYHRVHFDLATQLAEYCEISAAYRDLMLYAISEKNHAAINEEFDNRGIRKLRPDEERQGYQYFGEAFQGNRTSERLSNSRVTQVAQGYFISKEVKVFSVHGKQIRKSRHSERRNGELGRSPPEDWKLYLASSDTDWSDTDTENGGEKAATARLFLVVKGARKLRSKRRSHRSPEFEEEVATSAELFVGVSICFNHKYKYMYMCPETNVSH